MKAYKEGTKISEILEDGWSRGFQISQTRSELLQMGYGMTFLQVEEAFKEFEKIFDNWQEKKLTMAECYALQLGVRHSLEEKYGGQ